VIFTKLTFNFPFPAIQHVRIYGVECHGYSDMKDFYNTIAQKTGGHRLKLSEFSNMFDFIMSICYREQGAEFLQVRHVVHDQMILKTQTSIRSEETNYPLPFQYSLFLNLYKLWHCELRIKISGMALHKCIL